MMSSMEINMTSNGTLFQAEKLDNRKGLREEMEIKQECFDPLLDSSDEKELRFPKSFKPRCHESYRYLAPDFPDKEEDIGEILFKKEFEELPEDLSPSEDWWETHSCLNGKLTATDSNKKIWENSQHSKGICEEMEIKQEFFDPPLDSPGENESRFSQSFKPEFHESYRYLVPEFPDKEEGIGEILLKTELEELSKDLSPAQEWWKTHNHTNGNFMNNDLNRERETLEIPEQSKAKFRSSGILKAMSQSNTNELRYNNRDNLDLTSKGELVNTIFKCSFCSFQTVHRGNLKKHTMIHTGEKPFKCNSCSYATASKSDLQRHIIIHTGIKPFKCTSCSYEAALKTSLAKHLKVHNGDKPFKCSLCSYQGPYKSSLEEHLRIHTGERPFKCTTCSYQAARKRALEQHLKVHKGEKPFSCNYCSYQAIGKSGLQRHMRIHTGETFKCNFCPYQATIKSNLKTHIRIHTGEKPFKCSYCSYQATHKSSLQQHLKIHNKLGVNLTLPQIIKQEILIEGAEP